MGRLLSLITRTHGGEALAEFLFELRARGGTAGDKSPDWGEQLWERASRLLAEQWEVWGSDEVTAEQVRILGGVEVLVVRSRGGYLPVLVPLACV